MTAPSNTLARLRIHGSPYEFGRMLGEFGAEAVHARLRPSPAWQALMRLRGSEPVATMRDLTQQRLPAVWRELQGLAEGLALPLDEVFTWHCRGDLWARVPDGCTTVMLPGTQQRRICHNEDGYPALAGCCAIAECRVADAPRFASFVYPGSLPGHAFAVTDAGLAVTVNNLRFIDAAPGVPRMLLMRALLGAADAAAALRLLADAPRAGGFHCTLADRRDDALLSVEFGCHACSVRRIESAAIHTNHTLHDGQRDLPQIITGSSGFRQIQGERLLAQAHHTGDTLDPLALLADTSHPRYPLWRAAADDGDEENTLATADIRVRRDYIAWTVFPDRTRRTAIHLRDGGFDDA